MNETPTACKDKWKKIRENFRKANNLRKTKSGQAAKNFKPIRYAKELSFLSPYIISESEPWTNLPPIMSGDDDDEQSNITSPPSTPGSPALSVATTVSAKFTALNTWIASTIGCNNRVSEERYQEKENRKNDHSYTILVSVLYRKKNTLVSELEKKKKIQ
ncbi:Alcohol dehydrogenase transcription factor Myb/SANT-like [Popillia japonica]|uniref:Alcohol dehydrogenase transcription factor Myb/SANT-like n=1 Tax=Popillia japonica TaxID=7064 RepID=A0AAW1IC42_POPJA